MNWGKLTWWGPKSGIVHGIADLLGDIDTVNLDGASHGVGVKIDLPRDGTITQVGVPIRAITGDPPAYNVGVYELGGTRWPDTTTPYGGSATTAYDFTATGLIWVTLGTPATAVKGDVLYAVVFDGAVAPTAGNYITVPYGQQESWAIIYGRDYHGVAMRNGGGWGFGSATGSCLAIKYADGYVAGCPSADPTLTTQHLLIGTGDTPDEVGLRFTLPFDAACEGAGMFVYPESTTVSTWRLRLYEGAVQLAQTEEFTSGNWNNGGITQYSFFAAMWPTVQQLSADTVYRVTCLPTHATNEMRIPIYTGVHADAFVNGNDLHWLNSGEWQYTERTDAGAFTDKPTFLSFMNICLSRIGPVPVAMPDWGAMEYEAMGEFLPDGGTPNGDILIGDMEHEYAGGFLVGSLNA